ncbi:hypothetical protein PR048_032408 [Dryococelus australis]|uniref:14 kDa phosphohistidine phosphatase n=1 Tax=Dryococelus australis TaxID=614101 RepID=A0ABQ9G679_9NEOP|nr:hypothetical protein PR048_032408 [Dryococelus australis]
MATKKLETVADVDIDPEGTFKYVLIKVHDSEESKLIVRGWKWAEYHADIYDRTSSQLQKLGLDTEVLGGGRIQHNPSSKQLKVYGYSVGFGKADHEQSCSILKKHFPSYSITSSDEGY